jgi:tRNA threonylcarbamoyl adenosine modification protein YeaZ
MKILALELSSARGSLAWLNSDEEVEREWPNDRKDSGPFFEHLKSVTEEYGLPDTIIVGLGPGSYAGGRIAISASIGLQAAAKARLVGYPSICAIDGGGEEFCVIGDARRQSFFFARVRNRALVEDPALLAEKELREKLAQMGDKVPIFACENLPPFEGAMLRYPSALLLGRLAREGDRTFALPPLEPIYLREPHITMPRSTFVL